MAEAKTTGWTPSLVWGERRGGGASFEARSPLDGSPIVAGDTLGDLSVLEKRDLPRRDFSAHDLAQALRALRSEFVAALRRETGFNPQDCKELVDGSLAYAEAFDAHPATQIVERSEAIRGFRNMRLVDVPVGTVAAILPHNAFLPLALACLLNGLRAGNRVILRAPQQSALSASLLASALERTPEIARWSTIAVCSARPFVDWFMGFSGSGLLHFFGGSRQAASLVARGFDSGKPVLIDGEGNAWVYVDASFDPEEAARIVLEGAFRYAGQTCTSINGALVHPSLWDRVSGLVRDRAEALRSGLDESSPIGPVFDEAQAAWCLERVAESGGTVATGGTREGALVAPTVVLEPRPDSALVREGAFGPLLWMAPADAEGFAERWATNRYPLCAAVLQNPVDAAGWASRLPNLARLVLNGDPSIEDPFEYWGGYPPSGQNAVSAWPAKYRRTLQIETPDETANPQS